MSKKKKIVLIVIILSIVVIVGGLFILDRWNRVVPQNNVSNENLMKQNEVLIETDEGILEDANQQLLSVDDEKQVVDSTSGISTMSNVDTSNWDLTKVNIEYDTAGVAVPVPIGFTASSVTGEHTVNDGFVVYEGEGEVNDSNYWEESKERNQFVWVPVADPSRLYTQDSSTGKIKSKLYLYSETGRSLVTSSYVEPEVLSYDREQYFARYNMQGYTKEKLLQELEIGLEETIESIEKYGGFYIGRYETGNITGKYEVPVVRRMNTDIGNVTWYRAYVNSKNISMNLNIQPNLIYGCLWDETIQWLVDSGEKTVEEIGSDSIAWGNYSNNTFEYTTVSGGTATKEENSMTRIPTGSAEVTKANNIYDIAGNVFEWTAEVYGYIGYSLRGGNFYFSGDDYPASNRSGSNPYSSDYHYGARAYFYIK